MILTTYKSWDDPPSSIVNHQPGKAPAVIRIEAHAGCRSFDTASIYKNEAAVGRALQTFGGEGALLVILVIYIDIPRTQLTSFLGGLTFHFTGQIFQNMGYLGSRYIYIFIYTSIPSKIIRDQISK